MKKAVKPINISHVFFLSFFHFSSSNTGADRKIAGKYLPQQDKVLFWDGKNIGMRGDYNGVLFLETILQTPVKQTDDTVKLEILLSEAVLFLQSLQSIEEHGLENTSDVINEFVSKITEANSMEKKGIKAQKVSEKNARLMPKCAKMCVCLSFCSGTQYAWNCLILTSKW